MKVAVVGGGSTYTPELADGITRLPVHELALIDPDARRLEVVGGLVRRMTARSRPDVRVSATTRLEEGIVGADIVLLQLRVGGQAARHGDETIPLEFGCAGQETTGPGGLAKALRTVPVVLDIAERAAALAPEAWLIDFTNPVGIVTRALLDAGHRAVGLCNVAITFQRRFARLLGVAPERIRLGHVGLNHLTWARAVWLDGRDVLPRLLAGHGDAVAAETGLPAELLRRLGVVPSYYLRYFYEHDAVLAEQRSGTPRAERVAAIERELLAMYEDPALDEKPALLGERGGAYYSEAAIGLIAALTGAADAANVHVVNVRNDGALPFLPPEAVIEVPARVGPQGAEPLAVDPVPPLLAGLIAHVAGYEELAVQAAVKGGADRVTDALLAHPLVGQHERAVRLTERLVQANASFLGWTQR